MEGQSLGRAAFGSQAPIAVGLDQSTILPSEKSEDHATHIKNGLNLTSLSFRWYRPVSSRVSHDASTNLNVICPQSQKQ
jgi:hypothetical protein